MGKSCNFRGLTLKHFTHTELMNNVKSFANSINIIRGSASYLVRKMQNIVIVNEIYSARREYM